MPLRILVVDDSSAMRTAIQRLIEISGLRVETLLTAENGKAALSVLKNQNVNLMLVDLNMPVMGGAELIRCLHSDPEQTRVPFIVLSADATANSMQEMLELGASAYIPKPFQAEALCFEMRRVLENTRSRGRVNVAN